MKKTLLYIIFLLATGSLTAQTGAFVEALTESTAKATKIIDYKIKMYPNPVTGNEFTVLSEQLIVKLEVLNVIGSVVFRHENNQAYHTKISVQLKNAERGVYMVRVTFLENKTVIKKLLVK